MKCDRGSRVSCKEDIPEMGCREGLEAETPSTSKESPRRPCLGWWRVKCWTDRWPARGPYAAGENRLCPPNTWPAGGKRTDCRGGKTNESPSCQTEEKWGWTRSAHQASRGGCDRFERGERVWGWQIRFCGLVSPRGGEAALLIPTRRSGMTRRSRSGRPVGPLQVNPSAWSLAREGPATGCIAWAPLPPEGSFLGSDCSLDKEQEGVEWSLVLLGMNCLRAADCVLAERNFSTSELTASPNNPDCEMGASSKNTFSFSWISVSIQPQMAFCSHWTRHRAPHGACGMLSGSESQVSDSAQLLHSLWSQTSPLVHLFKNVRLVGLKDARWRPCLLAARRESIR